MVMTSVGASDPATDLEDGVGPRGGRSGRKSSGSSSVELMMLLLFFENVDAISNERPSQSRETAIASKTRNGDCLKTIHGTTTARS